MVVTRWDTTNQIVQTKINGQRQQTSRQQQANKDTRGNNQRHVLPLFLLPLLLHNKSDKTGKGVSHPDTVLSRPSPSLHTPAISHCLFFRLHDYVFNTFIDTGSTISFIDHDVVKSMNIQHHSILWHHSTCFIVSLSASCWCHTSTHFHTCCCTRIHYNNSHHIHIHSRSCLSQHTNINSFLAWIYFGCFSHCRFQLHCCLMMTTCLHLLQT